MVSVRWRDRSLAAGLLLGCAAGWGQGAPKALPSLAEVMDRLRENYVAYIISVPNLFCDETVRSEYGLFTAATRSSRTVTESLFRLQRKLGADKRPTLAESRQVRRVDGKAVDKDNLSGPSILYGVFGSSVGFVSKEHEKCVSFKMKPGGVRRGRRLLEIEFRPLRKEVRDALCGERPWQGKAFVDEETMHLARIEMKTDGYEIVKGVWGDWNWEADYEPVMLVGMPFWLPVTIQSKAVSYETNAQEWTFTADYRNYHKMGASGRIVPGTVEELPEGAEGQAPPG